MQVYEKLSPSLNEYIDKATPYVKGAYSEASKVLVPFANDVATKGVPIITVRTSSSQQPWIRAALCDSSGPVSRSVPPT